MAFYISQMFDLKQMKDAKVIAGKDGLDNRVKGVTVLENEKLDFQIRKGSLVFANHLFLKAFTEAGIDYVSELNRKGASGIVYRESDSGSAVSDEMKKAADAVGLPIISVASGAETCGLIDDLTWYLFKDSTRSDVSEIDEGELVIQLITGHGSLNPDDIMRLHNNEHICALIMDFDQSVSKEDIARAYDYCRNKWGKKLIILNRDHMLIVSLCRSNTDARSDEVKEVVSNLLTRIEEIIKTDRFRIAIGRSYSEIDSFRESVFDAAVCITYMDFDKSARRVMHYEDMGSYRVFFARRNDCEIRRLYGDCFQKIHDYDNAHNTEYIQTIKALCSEEFSINATAQKMIVHYNTIVNRINRIKELFAIDLMSENDKITVYSCILIEAVYKGWENRLQKLKS